ncbi:hypothetical protein XPA_003238 [Xanthoria parietina]
MDSPQPSKAKFTFFSLPPEIRFQIYGYLAPNRIHILPNAKARKVPCKPWLDNEKVHRWPLASVSRQFRAEIRFIVCAVSVIEIHLRGKYEYKYESEAQAAYKAWTTNLHEELAARIKHLVLDDLVNIDWKPDGPVPDRPTEIARREMMQRLQEKGERGEELLEIERIALHFDEEAKTRDPLFEGPWPLLSLGIGRPPGWSISPGGEQTLRLRTRRGSSGSEMHCGTLRWQEKRLGRRWSDWGRRAFEAWWRPTGEMRRGKSGRSVLTSLTSVKGIKVSWRRKKKSPRMTGTTRRNLGTLREEVIQSTTTQKKIRMRREMRMERRTKGMSLK